jgi:serine O-acetyltransferase
VEELVLSCRREDCFDHVGPEPLPSRKVAIDIIHRGCQASVSRLLYPQAG